MAINQQETVKNGQKQVHNLSSGAVSNGILPVEPKYITKKAEYLLLLRLIKRHKLAIGKGKGYNIQTIVRILNINTKTARKWLGTPKVQQAIVEEMEYYIEKMQETGANDWRQWARQIELAQGITENKLIKNQNQLNVIVIRDKEKGIFEIREQDE